MRDMAKSKAAVKRKAKTTTSTSRVKIGPFPIVGIGASAGGLAAFEEFFSQIPPKNGMAFVIVTHLDREHISRMPEIIQNFTTMPVVPVKKKMPVQPNTVYVITPKNNLSINKGVLTLTKQIEPHYKNQPISYFFHVLGEDQKDHAFAVILSGSGADGALGLREIKQHNGAILVQYPKEAEYDSMPQNAINTGLVDYVLSAKEMYGQIDKLRKSTSLRKHYLPPELQQIFILLQSHTGHDFSSYKLNTIYRRIERQMQLNQVKTFVDYVNLLRQYPQKVDNLFYDLLIGVTCFFRDPEAFAALKKRILDVLKDRPKGQPIRVWVPGCATGEEVYSLAILFKECLTQLKKQCPIQIFGTDIDLRALEIARAAVYPETIEQEVNKDRLQRFFIKMDDAYKVKKEIRETVVFGSQNIISDPPFTKLDFLSCRNLLIYLNADLQKKLIPLFHHSLKPKGTLFLGFSEATSTCADLFNLVSKKWKIFERKETTYAFHTLMNFPIQSRLPEIYHPHRRYHAEVMNNIKAIQSFLIHHHFTRCAVVDKTGEIVYLHGKIDSKFLNKLKLKNSNIIEKAHVGLRSSVKSALREAIAYQQEFIKTDIKFKYNNKIVFVVIRATPIKIKPIQHLFVISIEELPVSTPSTPQQRSNVKMDKKVIELEKELKFMKSNLESTIDELATSNEELQSTNEELQSTNEEIETSKEELQSLNEELIIVNTELQNRIDQLALVHDDMNNLFSSTEIAAFFLDNELRIKRFTPKAKEMIHLLQSDIGRPIGHFATSLIGVDLIKYASEVLNNLMQKSFEVKSKDGKWFIIRILPYRTVANVIDGVVITFTDITTQKENEQKLLQVNTFLNDSLMLNENILDTLTKGLIVLDDKLRIVWVNRSFYNLFMLTKEKTIGAYIYDLCKGEFASHKMKELLTNVITLNNTFENYQMAYDFKHVNTYKSLTMSARRIFRRDSKDLILLEVRPI